VTRLRIVMMFLVIVSFVGCLIASYRAPQLAFYMMPMRAWQFAVGALVWLYFNGATTGGLGEERYILSSKALLWAGWLGLALLLGAGALLDANHTYPGVYALVPTVGAVCLVASGCRGAAVGVSSLLSSLPMQAIGRISYAWYLWHWPVLLLGKVLTGVDTSVYRMGYIAFSLVLAVTSYYCVESPIRQQKWWMSHQRVAVYGALVLMLLLNVVFQGWSVSAYKASQSPAQLQFTRAHEDAPLIYAMGCDDWYESDKVKICAFGPDKASHTVVLMGDSIAGQWFPTVAQAFNRPDWRLLVITKSSCPMVDIPFFYARIGRMYTECSTWRRNALEEISSIKPDVILLSSVSTSAFTQAQWIDGTAKVLDAIDASTGRLYLLRSTPQLPFDGPDCLAAENWRPSWLIRHDICSASVYDQQADHVYEWLQQAAGRYRNVSVLDMSDVVCPGGICAAEQNGVIVFRDSQHITATFAASLGRVLKDRLGVAQVETVNQNHRVNSD
jgi:hypothetical protein